MRNICGREGVKEMISRPFRDLDVSVIGPGSELPGYSRVVPSGHWEA